MNRDARIQLPEISRRVRKLLLNLALNCMHCRRIQMCGFFFAGDDFASNLQSVVGSGGLQDCNKNRKY